MSDEQIASLKNKFGEALKENVNFNQLTTVGIGGPAKALLTVKSRVGLIEILNFVLENKIPFFIIAGGSNLLVSDDGVEKLVIKIETTGIEIEKEQVRVDSGTALQDLVDFTIKNSLAGANKMTGIPGSVGGAIYGNAGAYGQNISQYLNRVICWNNGKLEELTKINCGFEYRHSRFKETKQVILEAYFAFPKGDPETLANEANECLALRLKKYPPGVKCPGSFFKNLITAEVPPDVLAMLPERKDTFGKLPAYVFIEELGLKGKQVGNIKIASYHGNLFINLGGGKALDFWKLAHEVVKKTQKKYGLILEPEVQLINLAPLTY